MSGYTFRSLSPADFEELCCDLLSAEEGRRFQPFAGGPDGGIDLLHSLESERTIVQCKHYAGSGFKALEHILRTQEKPKVDRLAPERYVICTSVPLSPDKKQALVDAVAPHCHGSEDVLGLDDLNALLRRHKSVEDAHHKLWLTSTVVLERILHAGAAAWKSIVHEEIEHELRVYVQSAAYDEAIAVLEEHHICVLSGIPGIGKTSLAKVLLAHYVNSDYTLVVAQEHVREAIEGLRPDGNFVVYYDDFLGQSKLEIGKNEDAGLIGLFAKAKRVRGRIKVILTTREYILREASGVSEKLRRSGVTELAKVVVDVGSYTRGRRARILYNHLFFSDLDPAFIAALVKNQRYKKVIDHDNFSPRVIEWMTQRRSTEGIEPEQFVEEFLQNLDNPVEIWKRVFEHKLTPDARNLLYCVVTFPRAVLIDALKATWLRGQDASAGEAQLRLRTALRQLDGSFLRIETLSDKTGIELHNPSISDFLQRRIADDRALAYELLDQAVYFEQVEELVCLQPTGGRRDPSGLIAAGPELDHAIRRTLPAGLPVRETRKTKSGSFTTTSVLAVPTVAAFVRPNGTSYWYWQAHTAGRRIRTIVRWSRSMGDSIVIAASKATRELLSSGQLFGEDTAHFTDLLEAMEESASLQSALPEEFAGELVAAIDESLGDDSQPMDWRDWGDYLNAAPQLTQVGDRAAWTERLVSFLEEQTRWIVENLDDDSVEDALYELQQVGEAWDVDITSFVEQIAYREPREDEDSDDRAHRPRRRTPWRRPASEDQDSKIERLFGTLPTTDDVD